MTNQSAVFTKLVAECYDLSDVTLESISPYTFEDRGIYRVRGRDGSAFVLRAFLDDVTAALQRQVAVLDLLGLRQFPAPTVRLAGDGAALAHFSGWTALLVTYIEGTVASFTSDDVEALAGYLGHLHNVLRDVAEEEQVDIRLALIAPTHPSLAAAPALANLKRALPQVPDWLQPLCRDSIAAIQDVQEVQRSGLLPETIIHGDCWPANAVKCDGGGIVLIDWDRAGAGPAFLDLCYLLLTCHLGKPQLPAMEPDEDLIGAVVRGYCGQRRPGVEELNLLDRGLLYDVALRFSQSIALNALQENIVEDVWLQKLLARYQVCSRIAGITHEYFERAL